MKKIILFFHAILLTFSLAAQGGAAGIPYQAIARDASGRPLANENVSVQVRLGPETPGATAFLTEMHQTRTDERGLFTLVIGSGVARKGALSEVPWGAGPVWMEVAVKGQDSPRLNVLSRAQLMAVPYAMHAATAAKLSMGPAGEEKNQSIYWTTAGNSNTSPPTHFLGTRDSQDLVIKTGGVPRAVVTKTGQVNITANLRGADNNFNVYPLIIQGSKQGIYIKVKGYRDGTNNFVTFGDTEEFSWGAIEGQTFPDLEAYWAYQLQITGYIFNGVALGGGIAAWIVAAAGASFSFKGLTGAGQILDAVALGIDLANLLAQSITNGINLRRDIGVTYSTGRGADYAEWLERVDGERDLYPGEVVGVRAGKVSLNTEKADHYRIVSKFPGTLGNRPAAEDMHRYEKIAFLGQVPVQVAGPVKARDFILPSGNNDGFAIAVHPKDMQIGDYARIIGVAWESGFDNVPFNYVNVAVGINANYLSGHIEALEKQVDAITAYLKGESQSLIAAGNIPPAQLNHFTTAPAISKDPQKGFTDEQYDQILDDNEALIREVFAEARKNLVKWGYDLDEVPYMRDFIDNPLPIMKQLRRDPAFLGQWAQIDQGILEQYKK